MEHAYSNRGKDPISRVEISSGSETAQRNGRGGRKGIRVLKCNGYVPPGDDIFRREITRAQPALHALPAVSPLSNLVFALMT